MKKAAIAKKPSHAHTLPPLPTITKLETRKKPQETKSKQATNVKPIKPIIQATAPTKKNAAQAVVKEIAPLERPQLETNLRRIELTKLVDTFVPIISHPRPYTPLFIDKAGNVDKFFIYSKFGGIFIEAKKYLLAVYIQKTMSIPEALEEMRKNLVMAMKFGRTLVIRMSNSAVDFSKFSGSDTFPVIDLFVEAGARFKNEEYWSRVVREEDRDENGNFQCLPEFFVVVTTSFELEDYSEFLEKSLPLNEMIPIYIEQI